MSATNPTLLAELAERERIERIARIIAPETWAIFDLGDPPEGVQVAHDRSLEKAREAYTEARGDLPAQPVEPRVATTLGNLSRYMAGALDSLSTVEGYRGAVLAWRKEIAVALKEGK